MAHDHTKRKRDDDYGVAGARKRHFTPVAFSSVVARSSSALSFSGMAWFYKVRVREHWTRSAA
jgi:hypothetical protein